MKYNKYSIQEIEIGDEIFFDDFFIGKSLEQSNYDEYWKVTGKEGNMLMVNLREEHYWSLDVSDVRLHIKFPK